MKIINPGELKHKIEIVKKSSNVDASGFKIDPSYTVILSTHAKISNESGYRTLQTNTDFSKVYKRFLIRYTSLIDMESLVKYDGKLYQIQYINDYEDEHVYMEVYTDTGEIV